MGWNHSKATIRSGVGRWLPRRRKRLASAFIWDMLESFKFLPHYLCPGPARHYFIPPCIFGFAACTRWEFTTAATFFVLTMIPRWYLIILVHFFGPLATFALTRFLSFASFIFSKNIKRHVICYSICVAQGFYFHMIHSFCKKWSPGGEVGSGEGKNRIHITFHWLSQRLTKMCMPHYCMLIYLVRLPFLAIVAFFLRIA